MLLMKAVSRLEEQLAEANRSARNLEGQLNEHAKVEQEAATAMVAKQQHQEVCLLACLLAC